MSRHGLSSPPNYPWALNFLKQHTSVLKDTATRPNVSFKYHPSTKRVGIITLHNESKRNAFNADMMIDLHDIVTNLDEVLGVVIVGAGGTFCSGFGSCLYRARVDLMRVDLTSSAELTSAEGCSAMSIIMQYSLSTLSRMSVISVAGISGGKFVHAFDDGLGFAIGGGAEIATASDFRLFHRNSRIQFVHAQKMGLVTGWGGAWRLGQIVGKRMALIILAGGDGLDAARSQDIQLCDLIVEAEQDIEEASSQFLMRLLKPPIDDSKAAAISRIKNLISCADSQLAMEYEHNAFTEVWMNEKMRGVISQLKK